MIAFLNFLTKTYLNVLEFKRPSDLTQTHVKHTPKFFFVVLFLNLKKKYRHHRLSLFNLKE